MNIFNLFAKIILDKSDYVKNLRSASSLTKEEAIKIKKNLLAMRQENKIALDNLIKDFAESKISLAEYNEQLKEINESEKEITESADSMGIELGESAEDAAGKWGTVATAILAAVSALIKLATASMDYADQVSDLAAQYGVSTDAISEMQYIADQSSTSIEGLTSSMTMLYNRAKQDGAAFQQLGISVKDTEGNFKTMDDLFWETIGALNDMEDEGERSAYMLDLFGRSAMNIGEVARKSSDEISRMRKEAHDLGIVMSEETIEAASNFNDTLAVLKLQGQSALASLVAGAPDAEEKMQAFFDHILEIIEEYMPAFVNFAVRLIMQVTIALIKIAPTLVLDIVETIQDVVMSIDWIDFGIEIGKRILQGIINAMIGSSLITKILSFLGIDIPQVDFVGSGQPITLDDTIGGSYEISENVRQDITVRVEASGDSTVSKETAEKTAEALAPYIDKILGGK